MSMDEMYTKPSELLPNGQSNSNTSELFKRIDLLIKNGQLKEAQEELRKANELRKNNFQKAPFSILTSEKCILPEAPLPPKPIQAMINSINLHKQVKTNLLSLPLPTEETQKKNKPELTPDRKLELNGYREALYDAWRDGALTESEIRQLSELRSLLEITDLEHQTIEREIKINCFKDAVSKYFVKNSTTQYDAKTISELRKTFQITELEFAQIQTQFAQSLQNNKRPKIMVIDDEVPFLKLITSSIIEEGFDVTAVATSDEALFLLQQQAPDLILCDINLKSSSMNGFILYSKIQSLKHLQQVPFVFLTGLAGEEIIRTVKELGADDCLVKPFTKQALLSTIRGKLKRFNQLKNLQSKN